MPESLDDQHRDRFKVHRHLQDGPAFGALQSGPTGTPFAIGSSVASISAGRLIERSGRRDRPRTGSIEG